MSNSILRLPNLSNFMQGVYEIPEALSQQIQEQFLYGSRVVYARNIEEIMQALL